MFCCMIVVIALYIDTHILLYDGGYSVVHRDVCFVQYFG